ncbi:Hypp3752 [Branchiostoma lanceolatum]|uniref:Hypp3752 protein n=1 Tax=Branchiostoma lanceolatum TaxID=7740 RepID=A0A8K0ESV0_BRALA|nr:Hypp3752 [Branchiostoma lanceolatum]
MDVTSLICVSLYVAMVTAAGSTQFPHAEPSVAAVWGLTVGMVASSVVLVTVPVVRYFKRAQRDMEARLMTQLKETREICAVRKGKKRYKRLHMEMKDLEEMTQKVEEETTIVKEEQKKMQQFYAEREIALKQWAKEALKHTVSVAVTKALRNEHLDFEKRLQNNLKDMCLKIEQEVNHRLNNIDCEKTEIQKMSEQFSDLKSHVDSLCEISGHYNMLVRQTIQKMCRYSRQVRSLKESLRHPISVPAISDVATGFLFKGTRRRIHERWLIEEAMGTPSGRKVQRKDSRSTLVKVMEMATTMKKRNSDMREIVAGMQQERERLSRIRNVVHTSLACTDSTGNEL